LEVDEDLPNFFDAIIVKEAKCYVKDNEHIMQKYGFEILEYDLIERLNNII